MPAELCVPVWSRDSLRIRGEEESESPEPQGLAPVEGRPGAVRCKRAHAYTILLVYQSSNYFLFQLYRDAIAVYRRSFGTSPRTKDTARGAAKKNFM